MEKADEWHLACTVCVISGIPMSKDFGKAGHTCAHTNWGGIMKVYALLLATPPLPKLLCTLTQDPSPTVKSSQVFGQWTLASKLC